MRTATVNSSKFPLYCNSATAECCVNHPRYFPGHFAVAECCCASRFKHIAGLLWQGCCGSGQNCLHNRR